MNGRRLKQIALALTVCAVLAGMNTAAGAGVDVEGTVRAGGRPACAMVLANGQHTFSCDGAGNYQLTVPLNRVGEINLFAFADGMSPKKTVLTPDGAVTYDIDLAPAGAGSRAFQLDLKADPGEVSGWVNVFGEAVSDQDPISALVLVNGGHGFSAAETGRFRLRVPLDPTGQLNAQGFADGFAPFKAHFRPQALLDRDGDGYSPSAGDCRDEDASVLPGRAEIRGDGIDQDCDGVDPAAADVNGNRHDLLEAINSRRVAGGYCEGEYYAPQPPIVWDAQVASAALTHAQDMAAHSFLDTLGSDGSTPKERVVKAGYDPTDVVELWMGGIDDPSVRDDWLFEDWPCRYLSSPGVAAGAVADTTGVYRRNGELVSANFHYTVVTLSGSCAEADGGALRYVHGILRESYLWYDQVPRRLNYANYTDADELLSYNRYAALDRWSYITDAESYDNLFQAGRYVGYGFGAGRDAAGHMRIRFVYRDSPAQRAGLRRGDRIVEVNGSTAEEIDAGNLWGTIYGDAELGLAATLAVQDGDGQTREVSMVKAWVEINTVLDARVHLLDDGRRVGYLVFQSFLETAPAQLEAAFAEFAAAGVDELVLDLRYNGGGRLDVAALLAGLIGGEITAGKTFAKLRHNTKYSAYDQSVAFSGGPDGLNLNRVVVITTQDSCSASEAVINGLRPYLDVVTVGTATCGKPVGMYGYNYCDKHLAPIEFEVVNAAGEGGYHEGIAATCAAGDELGLPLGDAGEASLRAALAFLRDGQCTLTPAGIAPSAKRPLLHAGFRREVGAD